MQPKRKDIGILSLSIVGMEQKLGIGKGVHTNSAKPCNLAGTEDGSKSLRNVAPD